MTGGAGSPFAGRVEAEGRGVARAERWAKMDAPALPASHWHFDPVHMQKPTSPIANAMGSPLE